MSGRRWLPPVAWAALILTLTSVPGPGLVPLARVAFLGADKWVHAILYGVLGWLSARAWWSPATVRRMAGMVGVIAGVIAAAAAAEEWHQQFIPGRSADRSGWLADTAAAACGTAALTL